MFTTFLAGTPFSIPPRSGRRRQKKRQRPRRDTTTGRQSASTTNGGQKGNVRSGGSTGGSGSGGKVGGPVPGKWISDQWGKYSESMGKAVSDLQSKSKKFEVPVKVDVDWVKPTLTSMKDMATEAWDTLPPPVQRVSPYLGVSILTAFIMQKLNGRVINAERHKNDELQTQIVAILKENKELDRKIRSLQEDSFSSPRVANELKMANAVSQATLAAAQAAEAAAAAAQACGLRVRRAVAAQNRSPAASDGSTG